MAPYTKMNMKDLLSESLYLLMSEYPFDKITIKNLCDKTGVIRGTFYHHFADKYEALEYLTRRLLSKDVLGDDMLKNLIQVFYEHRSFFTHAFQVQGQNSFEDMLRDILSALYVDRFSDHEEGELLITKEYLAAILANTILYILRDWIGGGCARSCDEIDAVARFILGQRMTDLILD